MAAKICSVCRKSDILCSACNKLLVDGRITKTDIDVARVLEKLKLGAEIARTIDYDNKIVIIAGRNAGRLIGKGGKMAKELTRLLGKDIEVVEEGDEKKMIEKMLRVPTLGINKVYGAQEKYKVRIEKRFKARIRTSSSLISAVLSKPVELIFE